MPKLTSFQIRLLYFMAVMVILSLCICALVVLLATQTQRSTEDVLKLNGGAGTLDNPIRAGGVVYFSHFNVLPAYYVRPATDQVVSFHIINRPPSDSSDYVLVRFRFECKQRSCKANAFNVRIIDSQGQEWGRPFGIRLDENLEGMEVTRDGIVEGWQVFSIPKTVELRYLKMWQSNGLTLYSQMPSLRN